MLKDLLKNKNFDTIIKKYLKIEGILDIIIFGSFTKGKDVPNDLDILVLFSKIDSNISYNLRKELEKLFPNVDVIDKDYAGLYSSSFLAREAILAEGYSLRERNFLHQIMGYSSFYLFKYQLKGLNKVKRMQFYYGLYGRGDQKGILNKYQCIKFSEGTLLVPIQFSENIKEFFENWKLNCSFFSVLIKEKDMGKLKL